MNKFIDPSGVQAYDASFGADDSHFISPQSHLQNDTPQISETPNLTQNICSMAGFIVVLSDCDTWKAVEILENMILSVRASRLQHIEDSIIHMCRQSELGLESTEVRFRI